VNDDIAREPDKVRRQTLLRVGGLVLLAAVPVLLVSLGLTDRISLGAMVDARDTVKAYVGSHPVQSAIFYVLGYGAAVALSIPGSLIFTVVGGFAFGWVLGTPLALLAGVGGGSLFFVTARALGASWVAERAGPRLSRLIAGFRRDAFHFLLSLRLVPLFPFWIVNTGAALAGIPLRVFVAGTVIGAAPSTLALSMAGAGVESVVAEQAPSYYACRAADAEICRAQLSILDLVTPQLLLGLTALGIAALIPVVLRRTGWLRLSDRRPLNSKGSLSGE
jgi:uncharacterized membrane protein YdjX (TVP38/TMEM64 family)